MFGKPVLRRHVTLKPIFTDAIIVYMIKLAEYEKTRSQTYYLRKLLFYTMDRLLIHTITKRFLSRFRPLI